MVKKGEAGRGRFGQGVDFVLTFKNRSFTIREIALRYKCTDTEARNLIAIVETQVAIDIIGFAPPNGKRGPHPYLMQMKL